MTSVRVDGHTVTIPVTIVHVMHEMDGPGDGHVRCTSPSGRRAWCFHEWVIGGIALGSRAAIQHTSEASARDEIALVVTKHNVAAEIEGNPFRLAVRITLGESWRSWPEAF